MESKFAKTPKPPYYAVIFANQRYFEDQGYKKMSEKMDELVKSQPGFLGSESVRDESGFGVTISYWQSKEDILNWKNNAQHEIARKLGNEKWYEHFEVRIAYVEKAYSKND